MLILMTSPDALLHNGVPNPQLVSVLTSAAAAGNPVGIISNHGEPAWFEGAFGGSAVQFLQSRGRQSGDIVSQNAAKFGLNPSDVLVLASKDEDVQMGKNGHALLIAAGWSGDRQVEALGIRIESAAQFQEIVELIDGWSGQWWFSGEAPRYHVRALSDLSGYGKSVSQQDFAQRLTNTVKNGGSRLNALLAVTARSLLMEGADSVDGLVWGVYPSSKSDNDDTDTLCDFTHRLRTTVSRVRFSKRGEPLFIRHTASPKRSSGGGGDRTDPTGQVLTIHLNPFYKKSSRLVGKNVVVIDDCTTYGVSFGVAAAFLRKAGAASVIGIALGKFGNQLRHYEIDILTDPYAPVSAGGFSVASSGLMSGSTNTISQQVLRSLIQ
ncbi:phosphoribosyltransferase [Rhizobium leguminosarum]|uniref:phosphoribosyltransferase n=1 Tax=Rhizobium leguminosarum TaxID=384 RepID=UPI001C97C9D4|nr:phosphoribosyltransferase [Rhizobium leguminosarum]MBY5315444.1 phosphoribosyltransferase [Rhizobium leguminosarum]